MNIETLTILMPCFNEENFVVDVLKKVSQVALEGNVKKEMIIIDDHSTDGTKKAIEEFIFQNAAQKIRLIIHEKNKGKGACIRTGLQYTSGQAVIIQDTDL